METTVRDDRWRKHWAEMDRRRFLKTTGGLFVASEALAACDGDPNIPIIFGTLRVEVTGLSGTLANGGVVTGQLQNSSRPPDSIPLPSNGVEQEDVPIGFYSLDYLPPQGFSIAPGTTNPQIVEVTEDDLTVATWAVLAANGSITVNVTGLTGGAANGGIASVLQTNIAGQSPINLPIPISGTATTSVQPGTYQVTYTPPSGFNLGQGVTNPQSNTVASNGTTTYTFAVVVSTGSAPNIYGHGFDDSTGGQFHNGAGQTILNPPSGWALDASTSARGVRSVQHTWPASGANLSAPIAFTLNPTRKAYYARFAMMQSPNYTNNDDQKINRGQGNLNGNWGSFLIRGGTSAFWYFWDDLRPSQTFDPNVNLPAPTANQLRGSWHWYEVFRDVTNMSALKFQVWIDDVLYFDYTVAATNPQPTFVYDRTSWWGTVNSMQTASTTWMDEIGLSTTKMGIP